MRGGAMVSRGIWAPSRDVPASVRTAAGAAIANRARRRDARALRGFEADESLGIGGSVAAAISAADAPMSNTGPGTERSHLGPMAR